MKIKGSWGEFDAPYLRGAFICHKLNLMRYIDLLIDTGASSTTILDNDALRLGIDYNKIEKLAEGTMGIGGSVDTYVIPDVMIAFRTMEGIHREKFGNVFVVRHMPRNREEEERIKRIPSLLGRDFLNKYSLFLNRKDKIVTISDKSGAALRK